MFKNTPASFSADTLGHTVPEIAWQEQILIHSKEKACTR
jgi:hypothetical protein